MIAKIGAKILWLTVAVALVFFGVGLVGLAIADAVTALIGPTLAKAIVGVAFLVPPLVWALVVLASRPKKPKPVSSGTRELVTTIFRVLARETPWIAVVSAGVAGAADMFLNRHKKPK